MTCSVSQSTVLSLTILYNICYGIDGSLYSYADDTALIVNSDTWQSVAKVAENLLSKIIE